ncbi:MAG: hypothetical protein H0W27_00150 [Actinobacteria bacterium]|nr:hypothetical protein [Actinomycetota bacterium]
MEVSEVDRLLLQAARLILAVVLGLAGIAKLRDMAGFVETARNLVPVRLRWAVPAGARALPVLEIASAAAMLSRFLTVGLATAVLLLLGFALVLIRALHLRLDASCACFGASRGERIDGAAVARTIGLLGLAAVALVFHLGTDRGSTLPLSISGSEATAVAIVSAAALATGALAVAALRLLTTVETGIRAHEEHA